MNGVVNPPYFYENEPITITCTATEYTDFVRLILINGDLIDGFTQTGCLKSALGTWDVAHNELTALLGLSTTVSTAYCQTAAQPAPFSITVQGTVTSAMVGARLSCVATVSVTEEDQTEQPVEVLSIQGK